MKGSIENFQIKRIEKQLMMVRQDNDWNFVIGETKMMALDRMQIMWQRINPRSRNSDIRFVSKWAQNIISGSYSQRFRFTFFARPACERIHGIAFKVLCCPQSHIEKLTPVAVYIIQFGLLLFVFLHLFFLLCSPRF